MESDEKHAAERTASLAHLVQERNTLIHQILPTYDPSTLSGCENMIKTLDDQHRLLASEYELVRVIYEAMIDAKKEAFSYILQNLLPEPK